MELTGRFVLLILAVTPTCALHAQDKDLIVRMTTPIEVHFKGSVPNYGSAFYFQKLEPVRDPSKAEPQWRAIQALYLVTAKHVIEPSRIGELSSVDFYLRRPGSSGVDWLPVTLSRDEVRKRLHVSPKPEVDIAVLDVLDVVTDKMMKSVPAGAKEGAIPIEPYYAVSEENFPTKSKITVSAGDDIVVIGYPQYFYDRYNKLPMLKSGILITPNGMRYNNQDALLIDMKSYKGLSGSAVITKPTALVVDDSGQVFTRKGGKDFVFLGVYAGQRYRHGDEVPDLGVVWYYYNLEEAVNAPSLSSK